MPREANSSPEAHVTPYSFCLPIVVPLEVTAARLGHPRPKVRFTRRMRPAHCRRHMWHWTRSTCIYPSWCRCQVWPTLAESVNVTKAAVAPSVQDVTAFTFKLCVEHCPVQGQAKGSAPKRAQRKAQSMCKFQCLEKCSVWRRQLCHDPGCWKSCTRPQLLMTRASCYMFHVYFTCAGRNKN